jgi:hypothetical protein
MAKGLGATAFTGFAAYGLAEGIMQAGGVDGQQAIQNPNMPRVNIPGAMDRFTSPNAEALRQERLAQIRAAQGAVDDLGASGDLVFALHNSNNNGGIV